MLGLDVVDDPGDLGLCLVVGGEKLLQERGQFLIGSCHGTAGLLVGRARLVRSLLQPARAAGNPGWLWSRCGRTIGAIKDLIDPLLGRRPATLLVRVAAEQTLNALTQVPRGN